MVKTNLDLDVLRTFVAGFELGGFGRAAERLGRSQSAVSAQLRRLEEQVGTPLVRKSGRRLALTTAGEGFFSYAKRLLDLNDEAVESIRGADLEGWVRLGLPQDFAETWLPSVLRRFARAHPRVRVEVQVDRSLSFIDKTLSGDLDVALVWGNDAGGAHVDRVAELQMRWIGRPDWHDVGRPGRQPLPFAAFSPPCAFRAAAIDALDAAGAPWRLVFTSPSLSGLWAAAEAGLGLVARTTVDMPPTLTALDPVALGLPALPTVPLALHRADAVPAPAVARLTDLLMEAIRDVIDANAAA